MNSTAVRANRRRLMLLAVLALLCAAGYLMVNTDPGNARLFAYSMKIRAPKLAAMALTAVSIGGASIVFQTIINNTIVTPCLLGMNSLYTLIHTAVVFFLGSSSIVASNANLAFGVDVILMGITATLLYGWIFRKTKHNVLYVLLVGTVLTSFFGSIQTTLTRVMDPNEYDALLSGLVASFSNINSEILLFSALLLAGGGLCAAPRAGPAGRAHTGQGAGYQSGRGLRPLHPPSVAGRYPLHRGGHGHGRAHILSGPDHR